MITHFKDHIVIRCDANLSHGYGHMTRCVELADNLSASGYSVSFAVSQDSNVESLVYKYDYVPSGDAGVKATIKLMRSLKSECIIIDNYDITHQFEKAIRKEKILVVTMDEHAERYHSCDIWVNSTPSHKIEHYKHCAPKGCMFLFGHDYVIIRKAIIQSSYLKYKPRSEVESIAIILGSADNIVILENILYVLRSQLNYIGKINIITKNPHLIENIEKEIFLSDSIQFLVDPSNFTNIILNSDLLITAGGVTALEGAVLSLPMLVLITAENQIGVGKIFFRSNSAIVLNSSQEFELANLQSMISKLITDYTLRMSFHNTCKKLFDGNGAKRISDEICKKLSSKFIEYSIN